MKRILIVLMLLFLVGCQPNTVDPKPEPPEPKPEPVDPFKTREFHVGGVWYEIPVKITVLFDAGWEPDVMTSWDDEFSQTLEANTYIRKYYLRNERYMMAVTLYNPTEETISLKDAVVAEVEGENRKWIYDDILDFEIDKTVTFKTTQEELKELWGEPDESSVSGLYERWYYKHTQSASTEIYWDSNTKVMFRLIVTDFKK